MEVPPSARCLLRVVYIMGIILVLLFLTLIGGIIWKANRKADAQARRAARHAATSACPPAPTSARAALDGDRLVITTGTRGDRRRRPEERHHLPHLRRPLKALALGQRAPI